MKATEKYIMEKKFVEDEIIKVSYKFRNCKNESLDQLLMAKKLATLTLQLMLLLKKGKIDTTHN